MAQNKPFRSGPIALTTTMTTNILNPGTTTGGVGCTSSPYGNLMIIVRQIRVTNKHASIAATFSLWLGATGANVAGTELALAQAVAVGQSTSDGLWFPSGLLMTTADFLVGGSNTATALTIEILGEIGVA